MVGHANGFLPYLCLKFCCAWMSDFVSIKQADFVSIKQEIHWDFMCDLYTGHKYKHQYSCQGISIESVQIKSSLQKYPIQSRQSD